mmetsp:Transcript_13250/g.30478  ORF Transcript_13250/g.30478 Transcript_13250/m.30478 type:complete len:264 (+) Transcript_13250:49-840(+)
MLSECPLLRMDDDMLRKIARGLLARDLRAALRLLQTCTQTRARLDDVVRAEAVARRLQWQPELSRRAIVGGDTLMRAADCELSASWTAGSVLPTTGIFTWTVHACLAEANSLCKIFVGVCDAACTAAWVAAPTPGARLMRLARVQGGCGDYWSSVRLDVDENPVPAPPVGFPCGNSSALANLRAPKKHRTPRVHVMVDHERGRLRFRVGDLPWATVLGQPPVGRLPCGAALRPWVSLTTRGDWCRFVDPFTRLVCADGNTLVK